MLAIFDNRKYLYIIIINIIIKNMKNNPEPKPIREILPDGFTMKVVKLRNKDGKKGDPSTVSRIVAAENTDSSYWPFIERLAMDENPKAYKERMRFLDKQRQTSNAA